MEKKMICNGCGMEIQSEMKQEYLHIKKEWGYFSNKDGEIHEFYLCESCYDKMTEQLQVPPICVEKTEYL